ncbi:MAG: diadenylate cyclase [Desulfatiglandaceae bacterium]
MLNLLPFLTLRDLADIGFLTIVAYHLYIWFRRTRALRVLIGLVLLGLIYSLAKIWGLFLTTWVFQILWQVLVILLLILFQSEIRQVLERVSPLRYLRARKRSVSGSLSRDIAQAAFDLAASRTGALMVISRESDPSEFLNGGHKIMALPEPILIKTIFDHHTPTHDGAMVISDGRISAVGCILPLSAKDNIPDRFGTRHRAALGLAERTDSICVVVSEERSEVSTVVEEIITVWHTPEALALELDSLLRPPAPPQFKLGPFLTGLFKNNWKVKLGSLALVSFAWLVLANPQEVNVTFSSPVRIMNVPQILSVSEISAREVRISAAGRRHSLKELDRRDPRITIDLTGYREGAHLVNLSAENIDMPTGVRVERFTPQNLMIILRPTPAGNTSETVQ